MIMKKTYKEERREREHRYKEDMVVDRARGESRRK